MVRAQNLVLESPGGDNFSTMLISDTQVEFHHPEEILWDPEEAFQNPTHVAPSGSF